MRLAVTIGFLVVIAAGCTGTGGDPQALLENAVDTTLKAEQKLEGVSEVSVAGKIIYREQSIYLQRLNTQEATRQAPASKSVMIELGKLPAAVEQVEFAQDQPASSSYTVIRARIAQDEAKNTIAQYLRGQISQIRDEYITEEDKDQERVNRLLDKIREEEHLLDRTLADMKVDSVYTLWIDPKANTIERLDAITTLRYNKDGSPIEEVISGEYRSEQAQHNY